MPDNSPAASTDSPINVGFSIDVNTMDVLDFPADVLVIGDWRKKAYSRFRVLEKLGEMPARTLGQDDFLVLDTRGQYAMPRVLVVGPTERRTDSYSLIREMAADLLRQLQQSGLEAEHISMTLRGVNSGLDEYEVFRAILLGLADAYDAGEYPPTLKRISFVEVNALRAQLMEVALQDFLPKQAPLDELVSQAAADLKQILDVQGQGNILAGKESFAPEFRKPEADEHTPSVFVAMPFAEQYDDQFYLAIRPAVEAVDHLCIRLDQDESRFTGDIVDEIKTRIQQASLVIALLDDANPNVYLEVGYAWGVEVPTVLVAHQDQALPFDVRSQRCLLYDRIYRLKDTLTDELKALLR